MSQHHSCACAAAVAGLSRPVPLLAPQLAFRSLMRRRSCLVCCGLAPCSWGWASAWVALSRHCLQPLRVHAMFGAPGAARSLIQRWPSRSPPRGGLPRPRCAREPASPLPRISAAQAYGRSLRFRASQPPRQRSPAAAAWPPPSLNVCPYRASSFFHHQHRVELAGRGPAPSAPARLWICEPCASRTGRLV